jgi:hypothetical protein
MARGYRMQIARGTLFRGRQVLASMIESADPFPVGQRKPMAIMMAEKITRIDIEKYLQKFYRFIICRHPDLIPTISRVCLGS